MNDYNIFRYSGSVFANDQNKQCSMCLSLKYEKKSKGEVEIVMKSFFKFIFVVYKCSI